MVSNPDLPVAIHTQSHQIPFQDGGLLVSYTNYLIPPQTTSATNLKLHTNLSSNPDTPLVSTSVNPPHSTLTPAVLKFRFSLLYSTAEEGHCDLAEIFIFVSFHLYMS